MATSHLKSLTPDIYQAHILSLMASLLINCMVVGSSKSVEGTLVDPIMCPLSQAGITSGSVPLNRPLDLASIT